MLFEDYVKKRLSHERGPLYEKYANEYILPDLERLPVTELRPRHLQALYDRLVTDLPLPRVAEAYAVADGALDEAVSADVHGK